ncbi:OmpA family protein [Vineibacter terrae]|uniref:OmpA family protein n=1 Tax=Vineibacter terrae TaxID=2586908 RepID=UPI002E30C845|nr:OmpA family protein [Vineibacter terrae]HEX2885497.1 OmpA family protein [Vineibacter terrae]
MKRVLAAPLIMAAAALVPSLAQAQTNTPGFYVGVEGGLNWLDLPRTSSEKLGFGLGGVVGYDFVGPRLELEGVWRKNKAVGRNIDQFGGFVNGLYDFTFEGSPLSPHVGIGVGVNHVDSRGTKFAMQGIVGVRYQFDNGLFASADYKLVDTFVSGRDIYDHSAMLTLGYKFGQPARVEAPPPAPVPTTRQSYVVFFDFDRANLTQPAMQTIQQAAASAKAGNRTSLSVTGHADRSGSDAYNMALSMRRANAVKDALVREGISPAAIQVLARGEGEPLVPTADGVREPQNRRVEIVIN